MSKGKFEVYVGFSVRERKVTGLSVYEKAGEGLAGCVYRRKNLRDVCAAILSLPEFSKLRKCGCVQITLALQEAEELRSAR